MPKLAFHPERLKKLSLPPRAASGAVTQVDYWDESQPAFGLRVSSSGARTWMLMTRVLRAGERKQIRVGVGRYAEKPGTPGALTLAEARAEAHRIAGTVADGEDPQAAKRYDHAAQIEHSRNTFGAVTSQFLTKYRTKSGKPWRPATRRQYEGILQGDDFRAWHDRPLTTIERKDVRQVLNAMLERGVTVRVNRALASVRKFFNWAVSQDLIATAPTVGVAAPVQEKPRDRHLFGDSQRNRLSEIALAWGAFEQCGPLYGAYLRLLLLNGQRRDEVAQVRDDELFDLDADSARWIIPGEKTKNGEEHTVPLTALQVEILRSVPRIAGCPYIFTTNGRTPINGFSKLKLKADAAVAALKAGDQRPGQFAEPWTLHDLRRTFSTGLIELGVSESLVDLLTNHKSGEAKRGVRRHYNHARREAEKRAAMLLWERHVCRQVETPKLALAA